MSNCHNNGRICWSLLADSISYENKKKNNKDGCEPKPSEYIWSVDKNKVIHFGNVMADVIGDFAETYKKEDTPQLNPTTWKDFECHSCGAQIAYVDSLTSIYICLNLILLNSSLNETPLFYSGTRVWIYDICCGEADISYDFDTELKSRFLEIRKKLFGDGLYNWEVSILSKKTLEKKMTKGLITEIRNYLKDVFECLIRIYQSEPNRYRINSEHISNNAEKLVG